MPSDVIKALLALLAGAGGYASSKEERELREEALGLRKKESARADEYNRLYREDQLTQRLGKLEPGVQIPQTGAPVQAPGLDTPIPSMPALPANVVSSARGVDPNISINDIVARLTSQRGARQAEEASTIDMIGKQEKVRAGVQLDTRDLEFKQNVKNQYGLDLENPLEAAIYGDIQEQERQRPGLEIKKIESGLAADASSMASSGLSRQLMQMQMDELKKKGDPAAVEEAQRNARKAFTTRYSAVLRDNPKVPPQQAIRMVQMEFETKEPDLKMIWTGIADELIEGIANRPAPKKEKKKRSGLSLPAGVQGLVGNQGLLGR